MADTLSAEQLLIFLTRAKPLDVYAQVAEIEKDLVYKHGLLKYDSANKEWSLTKRGHVYLEHLCSIPLPIHVWMIPGEASC